MMPGNSHANTLPWRAMIAFGLGRLRLAPKEFWALSYPEFLALTGSISVAKAAPLSRVDLEKLLQTYPDGDPDGR
ncbi:phage tail assembly chaperone [Pseudohoeflea coraliihabitans]|uniref:Phage tail assembly chaperone n=1 Tax=Pseudohoeflea coraliihabitans TaxID=2860393 RepID=A0ABS6WRW4_9HYPH|nr:phage tail assembly chaperone [Pseudohoeflea sp. DP4N28-3]MBW3098666.1 phage tail assembly chaperone [Pseudohoeflea sp. DP4N28-3]